MCVFPDKAENLLIFEAFVMALCGAPGDLKIPTMYVAPRISQTGLNASVYTGLYTESYVVRAGMDGWTEGVLEGSKSSGGGFRKRERWFLAVHNSSIGNLVPWSLWHH